MDICETSLLEFMGSVAVPSAKRIDVRWEALPCVPVGREIAPESEVVVFCGDSPSVVQRILSGMRGSMNSVAQKLTWTFTG